MSKNSRKPSPRRQAPSAGPAAIVIGGGLAGLTMTALLAAEGVGALCLDREPVETQLSDTFDGRTTAISYGSRFVLEAAGLWEKIEGAAAPIDTIHILDGDSAALLAFDKSETGGRIFGWIVENRLLRRALLDRLRELPAAAHIAPAQVIQLESGENSVTVTLADGSRYTAPLAIGADGRRSFTRETLGITAREWSYRQRAIICTAAHEHPHGNIAVEHFRKEGPFAILPMTDGPDGRHRSSVVWTEHGPETRSALRYDKETFHAALSARFPDRYGRAELAGPRFSHPLGLVHAHAYTGPRTALIAEAAHGIHPIAGQGLNMGMRDIAELAGLVSDACKAGKDPGAAELLDAYQRRRRFDNMAMAGATDTLNRLFSNDIAPLRLARRAGLRIVAHAPFAKRFFMGQAMGAAGLLPALIRESRAA